MTETIVVTGASGQLGRLAISDLKQIAPAAHAVGVVQHAAAAQGLQSLASNSGSATTATLPRWRGRSAAPKSC